MSLSTRVLLGLGLGVVTGLFFGESVAFLEVPELNHFTIVNDLSTPGMPLFERLVSTVEANGTA